MGASTTKAPSRLADEAIGYALNRLDSGQGPDKILLDMHGLTTTPADKYDWQYRANCILVRDDGWCVSCHKEIYEAARNLFTVGTLVAVICYANTPHRVVIRIAR